MSALLLLPICVALGFGCRRWGVLGAKGTAWVGFWVIYVALPALILLKLPKLSLDAQALSLALVPWGVFGVLAVLLWAFRSVLQIDRYQRGALLLTIGLGNTSFVGLPLITALMPASAVGLALAADQGGTFLALSLAGLPAGLLLSGKSAKVGAVLRRLLLFPPFAAALLALALHDVSFPLMIANALDYLSLTLSPMALFAVGLRLATPLPVGETPPPARLLALGVGYKLLLAPALTWLACGYLWPLPPEARTVAVLQAGMGPMITSALLAIELGLSPPLVARLLLWGLPLSALSLTAWWGLLS